MAVIFKQIFDKHKEIAERRPGGPIRFLLLPKMGLLGSQASIEKNK
jgi:hypothetical protein